MMNDPGDGPQEKPADQAVYTEARKKALHILEYADRTEKQLRDKLLDAGFSDPAVEDAVSYVSSYHYLDDRRYAEIFFRNQRGRRSLAEIRMMLSERGVSREILDDLLNNEEDSEQETIRGLFLKKYGGRDLSDPAVYQKAFRYFSGKGFRYDDIRSALENAVQDIDNVE